MRERERESRTCSLMRRVLRVRTPMDRLCDTPTKASASMCCILICRAPMLHSTTTPSRCTHTGASRRLLGGWESTHSVPTLRAHQSLGSVVRGGRRHSAEVGGVERRSAEVGEHRWRLADIGRHWQSSAEVGAAWRSLEELGAGWRTSAEPAEGCAGTRRRLAKLGGGWRSSAEVGGARRWLAWLGGARRSQAEFGGTQRSMVWLGVTRLK